MRGSIASRATRREKELDEICNAILALLNGNLLEKASNDESKVFYHKMKADYYRYIAE